MHDEMSWVCWLGQELMGYQKSVWKIDWPLNQTLSNPMSAWPFTTDLEVDINLFQYEADATSLEEVVRCLLATGCCGKLL